MDVKIAFLHGDLKEEIYMTQLENYVEKGKESLVCKLKSLYMVSNSLPECGTKSLIPLC
jgi:hypothetical protein